MADQIMNNQGRILAVDPGEKRIGLAISDPTQTIASPLTVIQHQSRMADAQSINKHAEDQGAVLIVIGYADHWDGEVGLQARKALRLKDELTTITNIPVKLWSEFGSTQEAESARRKMKVSRKKRSNHLDDLAATVILQSFLDAHLDGEIDEV
jgi:putative Holliday junction resolvase